MQYTLLYIFTNKNTIFTEGFYLQRTKFLSIYILSLYINNYKKNKNKSFVQILRYGYLPPTTQAKLNFLSKGRERTLVPELFFEIFLRDKEKASCESATTNFKKNLRDQGSSSEKARENNVRSFPLSVSTARKITVPLTITMVLENFKDETCLLHDLER